MNRAVQCGIGYILLGLAVGMVLPVYAVPTEEPQLFKARFKGGFTEIDSRYEEQERTSPSTGSVVYDDTRFDLRPKVHLDFDGSVYHSYLFDYDLALELGLNYEYELLKQPTASPPEMRRADTNPLQYYSGRGLILKEKRLSGAIFGNYNQIRLDNGFFSRRLLNQGGYGGELLYAGDILPWSLTAERRTEEEVDTRTPRSSDMDEIRYKASNTRDAQGRTRFEYIWQDFIRKDFNLPAYTGIRNSARLSDSSYFLNDFLHLGSSLYYNDIDSSTIPSETFTLSERLRADHTPNLKSTYEYNLGTRDSGTTKSVSQDGRAGITHQLYESLTSTAFVDYRDIDDDAIDSFRYGGGVDEVYTKRVGEDSRLDLGAALAFHREERNAKGGSTIRISNEPHVLTTGQLTTLTQPNVIPGSVVVTDPTGTILYLELIDYVLFPNGSLTEIQRVPSGTIPNGGTVLVTYDIVNPGSGTFNTREGYYRFRYSLLGNLLSFYGSLRTIQNNGAENLVLEDLVETVLGVDSTWRWFNVGAEYRDYDSTLLPTETVRFYQNVSFPLDWRSMLRLSAEQAWTRYPDTDEESRRFYQSIAYQAMLTSRLSFKADTGLYIERGRNNASLERDLLAANLELIYHIGKTTISATAEYRDEDYLNETRLRKTAYLRVRRML